VHVHAQKVFFFFYTTNAKFMTNMVCARAADGGSMKAQAKKGGQGSGNWGGIGEEIQDGRAAYDAHEHVAHHQEVKLSVTE
jgi:hypothetical protein